MNEELIAPCGMNCGICMAYLREKNRCPGCSSEDPNKPVACQDCIIKKCETIKTNESGFCFECAQFPCRRLKQLDKRYRTNYGMSMLENLEIIKTEGISALLTREEEKWTCPECGRTISCHQGFCYHCALEKRKSRKKEKSMEKTEEILIAPCGMNCGVCSRYLAMKYDVKRQGLRIGYCVGCRPNNRLCSLIIKRCQPLMSGEVEYCYECESFPCVHLEKLSKRYSDDFHMSMVENLRMIKEKGMTALLEKEEEKWRCPECGETISCHNGICYACGVEKLKNMERPYRWEDT